ncbi:MAG: magnesium and cobalt transport protein CorA [Chitinophagia bacterium]|nr:magnesium and cobalt transport protein CorA [Chitinophagia bacterium]
MRLLYPLTFFNTRRTREIFNVNPTSVPVRTEAENVEIQVFDFSAAHLEEKKLNTIADCFHYRDNNHITWINIDGIRKSDIEAICQHYHIHYLITEDILSIGQRPKMDEIDGVLFCLLNMLYFNEKNGSVETEQISIVLSKNVVISFQEIPQKDVFGMMREKLKLTASKLRTSGADYCCYALLDMIVDHYFLVMEKLSIRIEQIEERIIRRADKRSLAEINNLRKELFVLKGNVSPVRELINGFIRSESDLLEEKTTKYFKDIHDHIVQANDLAENLRDLMINLQDLYISQVNLKMNEVMKVMAIVTCVLTPATVIGGIFGMNFDVIPFSHHPNGFIYTVLAMILIMAGFLVYFGRKRWL